MPKTQYEIIKERLPKFASEIEFFTAKLVKAEAEGKNVALYDAYIRGYCTAVSDNGILTDAQAWADECRKRYLAKGGEG